MKLQSTKEIDLPTAVLGMGMEPEGKRLYAACQDGTLLAINPADGKWETFPARHDSYASGCVLLAGGAMIVSAGYDGQLIWHNPASQQCLRKVKAHAFWSWQLAASPNGKLVASVTGQYLPGGWKYEPAAETEPSVKVYDSKTGELVAAFTHTPPVLSCTFSPDNRYLAAANMMGEVRVWDLLAASETERAKPVSQWTSPDFTSWGTTKSHHHCGGIYGLAFSPDGTSLLGCGMGPMGDPMAGNGKMTWQQWNWRTGEKLREINPDQRGSGLMEAITWHPSGQYFAMAGRQAQGTWNLAIFSAADGKLVHSMDANHRITRAQFTADGKQLIISAAQGQPKPSAEGKWPKWGKVRIFEVVV